MSVRICNVEHPETGARCIKDDESPHGENHYGYAHYPGQVVTWPAWSPMPYDLALDTTHPQPDRPGTESKEQG